MDHVRTFWSKGKKYQFSYIINVYIGTKSIDCTADVIIGNITVPFRAANSCT